MFHSTGALRAFGIETGLVGVLQSTNWQWLLEVISDTDQLLVVKPQTNQIRCIEKDKAALVGAQIEYVLRWNGDKTIEDITKSYVKTTNYERKYAPFAFEYMQPFTKPVKIPKNIAEETEVDWTPWHDTFDELGLDIPKLSALKRKLQGTRFH